MSRHQHDENGDSQIVEDDSNSDRVIVEEHVHCTCGKLVRIIPRGSRAK